MEYDSFLELVKKRRSSWVFKPDPIQDESIEKIIDAARYAPSGFNSQPWEFVVIKELELRDKIRDIFSEHLPSQGLKPGMKDPLGFKNAPVLIILYGDPRVRPFAPPPVQKSDENFLSVLTSSLAITYQYMHLAAASLGYATRWFSSIKMSPIDNEIKELLGIPEEFMAYDMMAVGKTDFIPSEKKMRTLAEVIHYGRCGKDEFRTDEEIKTYFSVGYSIGNAPEK
ncbi:nitroreductase family protein [Thermodesulfobacteriota bacterium]